MIEDGWIVIDVDVNLLLWILVRKFHAPLVLIDFQDLDINLDILAFLLFGLFSCIWRGRTANLLDEIQLQIRARDVRYDLLSI